MENRIVLIALACALSGLAGCSGDRRPQTGKDSVENTYKVPKDTSKTDSSKTNGADNSGSGGAGLVKDTSRQAKPKK